MNTRKMAPDSELKAMMARGLRLWRGESHDGPVADRDDVTYDTAGWAWIPSTNRKEA